MTWEYRCIQCGHRLTMDGGEMPTKCPGCGDTRWVCRCPEIMAVKQTLATYPTMLSDTDELCHPQNSTGMGESGRIKRNRRGRGRPPVTIPDGQIAQLAAEGYGAKRITDVLLGQGVVVSYRTVIRRLHSIEAGNLA